MGNRVNPDPIDDIWPEIVKAFAFYGREVRPNPGQFRRELLQKRLDDGFSPSELVKAIHGYVHSHQGLDRIFENGLTSGHYLRPETVFKADGFEDRVERGVNPWVYVDPRVVREQQAKARQVAAQKRLDEARAKQAKPRLRAV